MPLLSLFLRSSRQSTLALTQTEQHRPASVGHSASSLSPLLRFSFLRRCKKSRRNASMEGPELDRAASSSSSVVMLSGLGGEMEAERYLRVMDELHHNMSASGSFAQSPACGTALETTTSCLEDEFRHILISRPIEIDIESIVNVSSLSMSPFAEENSTEVQAPPRSCNSIRELDLLPSDAIKDLGNIASRMASNGYGLECVQAYGSTRKSVVNQNLLQLGIGKLSIGDVQVMGWEMLEIHIGRWIQCVHIAIRVIFSSEQNLCKMIFGEAVSDDAPFSEAVKGPALQLLGFAQAVAIGRRSPEKLFKILDLHNTLSDLVPEISVIFDSKSTESISLQAEETFPLLADAVRGILLQFENTILEDLSETPIPDGTVHPLTHYVMNYISSISEYKQTLMKLIISRPSNRISGVLEDSESEIPLAAHLIWILFVLHQNLESKSRLYKDAALSQLFMMNNLHYIVHKVKDLSQLYTMIGDGYLRKLQRKLGQATNVSPGQKF